MSHYLTARSVSDTRIYDVASGSVIEASVRLGHKNPDNLDEVVKSLISAWWIYNLLTYGSVTRQGPPEQDSSLIHHSPEKGLLELICWGEWVTATQGVRWL
jgi:hypothetical protein